MKVPIFTLTFGLLTTAAFAQAEHQAQAALHVSATVMPSCQISVTEATAPAAPGPGPGPAVTASCAASNLRTLRVTTSRGDALTPVPGRQLKAGGDATFVVSRTDASGPAGRTIVVTLDF